MVVLVYRNPFILDLNKIHKSFVLLYCFEKTLLNLCRYQDLVSCETLTLYFMREISVYLLTLLPFFASNNHCSFGAPLKTGS